MNDLGFRRRSTAQRCFLSTAAVIGFCAPLQVQAVTISTAETDKVSLSNGDSLQVTGSGALSTGKDKAVSIKSPSNSIIINAGGSISSEDDAINAKDFANGAGTFSIVNSGTIISTVSGQAIDLNGVSSSEVTTTITNNTEGRIIAENADAVRPGANAIVVNYGTIYADGPAGESHDGVDFQSYAGTVINESGGLISGKRHGITSDLNVDVTNYGTVIGRNGSGIGSDGTGRVINYGTIIGAYDGSGKGDGDGIDIDGAFYVENYGTIEALGAGGLDKGGQPNEAESLALTGGGTLINQKSGIIRSSYAGVTICCSANPSIFANYGEVSGTTAFRESGTVDTYNYGKIIGTDYAVWIGTGSNSTIANFGSITGDTYGIFVTENHQNLLIDNSGTIQGGIAAIGIDMGASVSLILASGSKIDGAIGNYGSLTLSSPDDYTLASAISGTGSLTKSGSGHLSLTADSTFSGATTVEEGALWVNGSLARSVLTVASGASIGGTGRVGNLVVESGAAVAAGNDGNIGTLSIAGDAKFHAGSIYQAATTASGLNSSLNVSGTASLEGGTVDVLAGSGNYALSTRYTILTAAEGTNGEFASVESNLAFLTPTLSYDANNVYLTLRRNDVRLSNIGTTPNQRAVGGALETLEAVNADSSAIVQSGMVLSHPLIGAILQMDATTALGTFDQLSGEIHASARTGMFEESRLPRETVLERMSQSNSTEQPGIWMQSLGDWGTNDGNAIVSRLRRDTWGVLGGIDTKVGNAVVGLAGGYTHARLTNALASQAKTRSVHVLGYAGTTFGSLRLRAGLGYAHSDIDTRRSISFEGFNDELSANYNGSTLQGFGEVGYAVSIGGGLIEPFAGVSTVRVHTSGVSEQGGAAALAVNAVSESFTTSTLGLKAATATTGRLFADAALGWQYRFGNRMPQSVMSFAGSDSFTVEGTPISKQAAAVSIGAGWRIKPGITLGARYSGLIGGTSDTNAAKLTLGIWF